MSKEEEGNNKELDEGFVVAVFWEQWSKECKKINEEIDEISKKLKDAKFKKIEIEKNRSLASRFYVLEVPTILILKNGKELERFEKRVPKEVLMNEIEMRLKNEIYYQS